MTPEPTEIYARILADMRTIWGAMAEAMLRKRVRDVAADPSQLTHGQLSRIVDLLKERTLPAILGAEGADAKARVWRAWIDDASRVVAA